MKVLKVCGFGLLLGLLTTTVTAKENSNTNHQPTKNNQQLAVKKVTTVKTNLNAVNINTATAAELKDKLSGIGIKKAQAIVEYRQKNGKFLTVEQITEVSGIGKATLEKNRERILVN
ncbi:MULTISPECIES: ComEA family DNA-binding protein [Pasteurellaceae]|uniref:Helix-hairpin-helix domain-containing protein n=1 Tax=Pasteurella atlantica TaxID=2827233 RepID=A0AAW8CNL3_9PAST|nr:helix-hairpin-helix domain-containing protein [Pasteurella atlantica]MBR0572995.1 helix-hairpin-helix domain-containing protein [Pasteurella atlantica]MDP8038878.1 helix-hairpin-helix domain-containing protein [Pasteurella atlantica]MDP8041013.1 helix-hairpin-helix domain-containing protein [Pasteurella atlantica]MDP8043149.1 helix-hairpin-helix domain-containing protein [Pasteurella atlantica]MDP8045235.1 helix-hairpin-helix domain-containing protein [Pasteurella atlantica]